jgi:hypothetical protein
MKYVFDENNVPSLPGLTGQVNIFLGKPGKGTSILRQHLIEKLVEEEGRVVIEDEAIHGKPEAITTFRKHTALVFLKHLAHILIKEYIKDDDCYQHLKKDRLEIILKEWLKDYIFQNHVDIDRDIIPVMLSLNGVEPSLRDSWWIKDAFYQIINEFDTEIENDTRKFFKYE